MEKKSSPYFTPLFHLPFFYVIFMFYFDTTDNVDFLIESNNIIIPKSLSQHQESCGTIRLEMLDDLIVEGNETAEFFLKSTDLNRIIVQNGNSPESRTLTIIDDDSE